MTIRSEADVTKEVQEIINAIAGKDNKVFFTVKACHAKTSSFYRQGPATGMYTIDIWSLRSEYNPRQHMFRTTKQGVVPTDKISLFVKDALAVKQERAARQASREEIRRNNEAVAFDLRAIAKESIGWASEYTSNNSTFVSADSGTEGKVKVGIAPLVLTPEQAKQLFALVETFK